MAKYTIELRNICYIYSRDEVVKWFSDYDINNYLLPDQIEVINNSTLWNKKRLANDLIDHFYMREIGFETPYLFKHYLSIKMREIMQEKLPLIYTTALEYDPLINVDYTETFTRSADENGNNKSNGNSNSSSNNSSSSLTINSDTPQGQISKNEILAGNYATSTNGYENQATISDETSNNTSSDFTTNHKEEYIRNFKGNQGISATYQAMIKQFRENIVAINKEIINELNSLFMGLY